ncbi:hypothetical protein AZI86_14965 [Bdellovibrio bacteriovorus]|uniref:Uncharacterized protein n=1 Tax=Bdellovibrio bacteriovorus TaxID=959 RepID=A0A150WK15_BDEBC|nr:hypothetical protein [Bdellovibrio bacteriovorus]KYG64099.1 hypothetical protein AZI86_14965 [Bdellovibrio bacteriovorus]
MLSELKWVFVIGLFAVLGTVVAALTPPHLNSSFHPRMVIDSVKGQITLDDLDFTSEPGELHSFAELGRFFDRQEQIIRIVSQDSVRLQSGGQEVNLQPRPKQIKDIPVLFWIQIVVGVAVFCIAGWVWSLRHRDLAGTFFFLAGFSVLVAALPSAIYTSRELALPKNLFVILGSLNAVGGGLFGAAIVPLFLVHPLRVSYWKSIAMAQALISAVWVSLYVFRIAWANVNLCIVVQMIFMCLVIAYQLWISRKNHHGRAALTWLGMSMIFGGGAFVVFNTIPVLLKIRPLNQGYSFVFLLFIFLGIAAGLTQFRFFKWARWVFYFCFYTFSIVAFSLLYSGFILVFRLNTWPAVVLALFLILILYMPLRDSLWQSLSRDD